MTGENKGVNRLCRVLNSRMRTVSNAPLILDFGVIQEDYSLLTNTFPMPIPKSDYMVCRSVTWNPAIPMTMTWWADEAPSVPGWEAEDWSTEGWQGGPEDLHNPPIAIPPHGHGAKGEHDHDLCGSGKHYHDVYLPDKMRWIKPGDRVLVAWVQNDAIVVDIVVSGEKVGV